MITESEFTNNVFFIAKLKGYKIEISHRNQIRQIDFGNKKLHEDHIKQLYPTAIETDNNIAVLIENVAPGRPCTHKPMREIIEEIKSRHSRKSENPVKGRSGLQPSLE